jgi:hypothetical protein
VAKPALRETAVNELTSGASILFSVSRDSRFLASHFLAALPILLGLPEPLPAQTTVTIAGTGSPGFSGDGGLAVEAAVNNPYGLTIGPDGALYFCEIGNHRVRRLDLTTKRISTEAGSGKKGYSGDGGPALSADLNEPYEVRFDGAGNMYFAEMQSHVVRRIDARTRIISTVAGTGVAGFAGDGGPATRALLRQPHSIAFDQQGRLLICDIGNLRIRRVDLNKGVIETWSGTGEKKPTPDGSPITGTPLNGPAQLPRTQMAISILRYGKATPFIKWTPGPAASTISPERAKPDIPATAARRNPPSFLVRREWLGLRMARFTSPTPRAIRFGELI